MTFLQAAQMVLETNRGQMKAIEILERIRTENLVESKGRTPLQTLIRELNKQYFQATATGIEPTIKKNQINIRNVFWYVAPTKQSA